MAKNQEKPLENAPKFKLSGLYVKDISFENPQAPGVFLTESAAKPGMGVGVDVNIGKLRDNAYEVALRVTAKADGEGKALFLVEVVYAGLFIINPELKAEEHDKILLVECASVIFPFARRLIADLVQEGGFPALLLEPINFEAIYNSRKAQAA